MSLFTVGPNCCSNRAQCGHRKSSYIDSTTFGSELPSFLMTLLDATRTALASPDCGFLSLDKTMYPTSATAKITTIDVSPIWIARSRLRSAAFRSYLACFLGFVATGQEYRRRTGAFARAGEMGAQRGDGFRHGGGAAASQREEVGPAVHQRAEMPMVDVDPCCSHGIDELLALVAQRVEPAGEHERGRQSGQVVGQQG